MKPTRVAVLAALGMLLTSVSVYSLTPPGGVKITADDPLLANLAAGSDAPSLADTAAPLSPSEFQAGNTLHVEGRLGHPQLGKASRGETFVMLEVKADPAKATARAPVNLALVIDRSGSMKGNRLRNAIQGALAAVDRLNEGDTLSVVTFDARSTVLVAPTTIDAASRARIRADIQRITLGGETCISCGVEDALTQLGRVTGRIDRMIVLSDGDATAGVRDLPGFRSMASRARDRGTSITTIGVDVDYNEKIMTAIAADSNGRHYFVENDTALERAFDSEAQTLTATLASAAEAQIELAPGVELVRVFDRTFRRVGNRVVVPLGAFSGSETKTVLVAVRAPVDREGLQPVADIELTYRDHVTDADGRCNGKLAVQVTPATTSPIDSLVEGRVNRSETSATLREANDLFAQGRVVDARRKLEERKRALQTASADAHTRAPAARKADLDRDFQSQASAVADVSQQFASPPAAASAAAAAGIFAKPAPAPQDSRQGKAAVKESATRALNMAF